MTMKFLTNGEMQNLQKNEIAHLICKSCVYKVQKTSEKLVSKNAILSMVTSQNLVNL